MSGNSFTLVLIAYFDLDLIVASAKGFQAAILSPSHNISSVKHQRPDKGLVHPHESIADSVPIVHKLVVFVSFRCKLRQIDVASRYTCPTNPHRPFRAYGYTVLVFVKNIACRIR